MTTQASAPPSTKSQALRSYDVADFPALTGLEDEWRFTPLKRLRGLVGEAPAATGAVRHEHADLPAGVTVARIGKDDPLVGSVLTPVDRISALAYGGAGEALLVEVARDAVVGGTVTLRVVGDGAGVAFGHTVRRRGPVRRGDAGAGAGRPARAGRQRRGGLADGAKLTLVTVAGWAADAVQAQHLKVKLGRDAKVVHIQVSLGGDLVRQYTSVEYTGRGGEAELYGVYFADGGQHLEHRQLVDHNVPDCRSYVGYRGALQGAARTPSGWATC